MAGDADMLSALRSHGFECDVAHWAFTLPALHAWLCPALRYPAFLKALYGGTLNQSLAAHGAEIVVGVDRGKVDVNGYRLQARRMPQASSEDAAR